jgi:hypothetical protein
VDGLRSPLISVNSSMSLGVSPSRRFGGVAGSTMVLPLHGVGANRGVLVTTRNAAQPRFTQVEPGAAAEYARRAAMAVELAELHAETGEAMLESRTWNCLSIGSLSLGLLHDFGLVSARL